MKPVVFNPVAVDDLEEIVNYISQDNAVAAEDVRREILNTAETLGDQPDLGVRPRFSHLVSQASASCPQSSIPTTCSFTANWLMKSKSCASSTAHGTFHLCLSEVRLRSECSHTTHISVHGFALDAASQWRS